MASKKMIQVKTADARTGDTMRLGDNEFPVVERDDEWIAITTDAGRAWEWRALWQALGATFWREVEEHPHGVIPDDATVVLIGGAAYQSPAEDEWFVADSDRYGYTDEEVQELADRHGFEVLWPRPSLGRLADGITDDLVTECAEVYYETHGDQEDAIRAVLEYAIGERE